MPPYSGNPHGDDPQVLHPQPQPGAGIIVIGTA
jgi:hypothetical protein